jgi:hypothetical protein
MSTYTQYYSLDKYEDTDRPNLRDQYNAAMDKIDTQLHTQDTSIGSQATALSSLQGTVASHTTQISTLQTDVAAAASTASTASSTASTASANVTQALAQLNNAHFYHIQNDQKDTLWAAGSWANRAVEFNAMIVFDDDTNHGLLMGTVSATSNNSTTTSAWQELGLVTIPGWTRDTAEGNFYCPACVINSTWGTGLSVFRMMGTRITWTPVTGISGTLPAGEAVMGSFMFPVVRTS